MKIYHFGWLRRNDILMSIWGVFSIHFFGMVGGRYTGWLRLKWLEMDGAVENTQKASNRLDSPRARFLGPRELQWLGQIEHIDSNSMTRAWPLKHHSPMTKGSRSLQQTLDNTWQFCTCAQTKCATIGGHHEPFYPAQDASAHLASTMAAASLAAGDSSPIRWPGLPHAGARDFRHRTRHCCCKLFCKFKFISFQKPVSSSYQEASAGPASALAQWHGGLRNAGAAAFQISSRQPLHVTSMGLMFHVSSRRLENSISYHRGKPPVQFQELFLRFA